MGLGGWVIGLLVGAVAYGATTCDVGAFPLHRSLHPVYQPRVVLDLLASQPVSRTKALAFTSMLERGEAWLSALPRAASEAALTRFREATPTIYLKPGELGVAAALLFHEIVHALDTVYAEKYFDVRAKFLPPAIREELAFRAERLAYDAQQDFIEELSRNSPCAGAYFEDRARAGVLIHRRLEDWEIRALLQAPTEQT